MKSRITLKLRNLFEELPQVSNNKRGKYADNLCWIHGIQVYASSEFTTAFQFTLFESAKAIMQLVNVMKMESSCFGLAHMPITTNFYLNSNKLATSYRTAIVCGQISATLPFDKVSAIANLRKAGDVRCSACLNRLGIARKS